MIICLQIIDTQEDKHKFEVIYETYRGLMFYIANKILHNEQDAEDAVHTAFVSIAENMQKIDEPLCPKAKGYVVTITESKAIDLYRRKQRRSRLSFDDEIPCYSVMYDGTYAITKCFSHLPVQYKHILLLKYHYGYNNREVAKILNISEANVIKRIQRAKQKLEALCIEEGVL